MSFLPALLTFLFSTTYVIFLDHLASSSRVLQKAIVIIVIALVFLIYKFDRHFWKELTTGFGRLFFLSWITIAIQLLVLSTGGVQSPFLILIHIFMVGISFIFSFSLSLLFLLSSLIVLSTQISFNNPNILLEIISLLVIIPIAYIISKQYHLKDTLMNALTKKVKTTEAILESLPELIIVTDQNFKILSTNDATVRTLSRSRSELLDKPLFDVLLLKDSNNKLINAKSFFPDEKLNQPRQINDTLTLIQSPIKQREVTIQVQTMENPDENSLQISFIVSFGLAKSSSLIFDKARARYEALSQNIKQKLSQNNFSDIKKDMLLLEKIENDIFTLYELPELLKENPKTLIDLAKVCKNIVSVNQDFSNQLKVTANFSLPDFGEKDIKPLTVESYHVNPEQLTGPFFTVSCDVKKIEFLIKKLFDISILIASTSANPNVSLSVQREKNSEFSIKISGDSNEISVEKLPDIFSDYYGRVSNMGNLRLGSGVEGYLTKSIANNLNTKIEIQYVEKKIIFSLKVNKS